MKCAECGIADLTIAQTRQNAKYCKACNPRVKARARYNRVKSDPTLYEHARVIARESDKRRRAAPERMAKQRGYIEAWRQRNGLPEMRDGVGRLKELSTPLPWRACKWCGKRFISHTRLYCCDSHTYAARAQRPRPERIRFCDCGQMIVTGKRCAACVSSTRSARKRRERTKRRSLKRAIITEPFTLSQIAARDHHRCGLCGRRVDMTLVVPHDRAPTIDHILPIAAGGDDTRANVQLAHFICNSRKAHRGSQQLCMIG